MSQEDVKALELLADRFDPKGWGSSDRGELSSAFRNAAGLITQLEQELTSCRTSIRHLTTENARLREERDEARSWAEHWRAIFGSAEGFKFPWEAEEVKG